MSTKTYRLNALEELRFEVGDTEEALLKLTENPSQFAEVFGTELAQKRVYSFPAGSKVAVWTWHGCHIQLEGVSQAYSNKWDTETPMQKYTQLHLNMEAMREQAKLINSRGPRVLICGPQDSGKNSLAKVLMNYATRQGRCLIYVDLDPGLNDIIPGCVSAVPMEQPVSVEEGFSLLPQLAFFVGEADPGANPDLYSQMTANLAKVVEMRSHIIGNEDAKHGGAIINTSGLVEKEGYNQLVKVIRTFDVNVIYIMDDEKLHARLRSEFEPKPGQAMANQNGTPLHIEKVAKSGGVVHRMAAVRNKEFSYAVREYFYGSRMAGGHQLHPHRVVIPFSELKAFRVGGHKVQSFLLPLGASSVVDPCQLNEVDPSESLMHSLGGLSYAQTEADIKTSNLAGLVHIQAVDMVNKKYTLLVPSPGAWPGKFVIIGNMKWLDVG